MYDINRIIQRMMDATGCDNEYQLSKYLKTGNSTIAGWKNRNKVPTDQCFQIYEKTGCSMEWLITGKLPTAGQNIPDKSGHPTINISEEGFIYEYAETYSLGIEMSILGPGTHYDKESLQFLAKKMYRKLSSSNEYFATHSEVEKRKKG